MKKVNVHTRAGEKGKDIICPECSNVLTVYHFQWNALKCVKCKEYINKYDWLT